MKFLFVLIGCIGLLFGCQSKSTNESPNLEGDLYYTWLKFGSFYNIPDSIFTIYKQLKDSVGVGQLDNLGYTGFAVLEAHDLLKSPFIYIKSDSDSLFIIYMRPDDYKPFTKFSRAQLLESNKKVRVGLVTERLNEKQMICKSVTSIELVPGETLEEQRKFKVEDYR